jgi:hypothetical protein
VREHAQDIPTFQFSEDETRRPVHLPATVSVAQGHEVVRLNASYQEGVHDQVIGCLGLGTIPEQGDQLGLDGGHSCLGGHIVIVLNKLRLGDFRLN